MAELFQGESKNRIDAKGRVSVPVAFRRVLEANDPNWKVGDNPSMVVLYGWPQMQCLEVYSVAAYNEMLEKVARLPSRSKQFQVLGRLLATKSQKFQLDENGRVFLPAKLLEVGALEQGGDAVFAGMITKFEIWAPSAFEASDADVYAWYDENGNEADPLAELDFM